MNDKATPGDWSAATFDGSRREQMRRVRAMTVRQRLEALDELIRLSERMQAMPKRYATGASESGKHGS